MHDPKWTIFYDFHTMPAQPDVGVRFDVEAATDAWRDCGVDYVVFHARCNLGMAYYDTKVGIRHPSLTYDLFGKIAKACQRKGIALTAYLNAGLSHEEGLRHRDWLAVTEEGYVYKPARMGNFMRRMCYNSAYGDHLVAMVRELAANYPIAGFFFDCMMPHPCVGVECIREMKQAGYDWKDSGQLLAFARMSQARLAAKLRDAALAIRPDLLLYFNGVDYERQAGIGNYIEYECLPTGGWGYETFPVYSRYLRTLGKTVLNMTGRFHGSWADFGGIRTEPSLEYDCIAGIANGLRPSIGDHWHPRGDLNGEVLGLIKRVYGRLRKLDPYIDGATPVVDTAVVSHTTDTAVAPFDNGVLGAVRMLAELKVQFDVVTAGSQWKAYRLLVIPDRVVFNEVLVGKVRAHLAAGGSIISSGWSGLDEQRFRFALNEWGLAFDGEDPELDEGLEVPPLSTIPYPAYFTPGPELAPGLPAMPLNCYVRGIRATPMAGTETLATCMSSYFPRHWDGEHHHVYVAPDRTTGRPFATRCGRVIHLTHPVFSAYHQLAPVPLKRLVANAIGLLNPTPVIRQENLPSFARVTITEQPGRRIVYVMNYVPERRGMNTDMIEDTVESRNIRISLASLGRQVRSVSLAESGTPLSFTTVDGYVHAVLPSVRGWTAIVFAD